MGPTGGEPLACSTVMGFESEFAQNETRSTERETNRLLSEGRSNKEKTENFFTSNSPTPSKYTNSVDQESSSSEKDEEKIWRRKKEAVKSMIVGMKKTKIVVKKRYRRGKGRS